MVVFIKLKQSHGVSIWLNSKEAIKLNAFRFVCVR